MAQPSNTPAPLAFECLMTWNFTPSSRPPLDPQIGRELMEMSKQLNSAFDIPMYRLDNTHGPLLLGPWETQWPHPDWAGMYYRPVSPYLDGRNLLMYCQAGLAALIDQFPRGLAEVHLVQDVYDRVLVEDSARHFALAEYQKAVNHLVVLDVPLDRVGGRVDDADLRARPDLLPANVRVGYTRYRLARLTRQQGAVLVNELEMLQGIGAIETPVGLLLATQMQMLGALMQCVGETLLNNDVVPSDDTIERLLDATTNGTSVSQQDMEALTQVRLEGCLLCDTLASLLARELQALAPQVLDGEAEAGHCPAAPAASALH